MPYVRVELIEGRDEEKKAELARRFTQAMVECAGATPESVFVVFEDVKSHNWAVGGELISERRRQQSGSR
jgi:4-oxalocrotonate tautomerase